MSRGIFSATNFFSTPSVIVGAYPFAISVWVYFTAVAKEDGDNIVGITESGLGAHYFSLARENDSERIVWVARDGGSAKVCRSDFVTSTGVWIHICARAEHRTSRSLLVNGGDEDIDTQDANPFGGDLLNGTQVGAVNAFDFLGLSPANARIAEVGIWDVVLEDNECIALSRGLLPNQVRAGSLLAYWPLLAANVGGPVDLSGNKENLTENGTVPAQNHPPVLLYSSRLWRSTPLTVLPLATLGAQLLVLGEGPPLPAGDVNVQGQFHTGAVGPPTPAADRGFLSRPFLR